jgi:hypothetical protein
MALSALDEEPVALSRPLRLMTKVVLVVSSLLD